MASASVHGVNRRASSPVRRQVSTVDGLAGSRSTFGTVLQGSSSFQPKSFNAAPFSSAKAAKVLHTTPAAASQSSFGRHSIRSTPGLSLSNVKSGISTSQGAVCQPLSVQMVTSTPTPSKSVSMVGSISTISAPTTISTASAPTSTSLALQAAQTSLAKFKEALNTRATSPVRERRAASPIRESICERRLSSPIRHNEFRELSPIRKSFGDVLVPGALQVSAPTSEALNLSEARIRSPSPASRYRLPLAAEPGSSLLQRPVSPGPSRHEVGSALLPSAALGGFAPQPGSTLLPPGVQNASVPPPSFSTPYLHADQGLSSFMNKLPDPFLGMRPPSPINQRRSVLSGRPSSPINHNRETIGFGSGLFQRPPSPINHNRETLFGLGLGSARAHGVSALLPGLGGFNFTADSSTQDVNSAESPPRLANASPLAFSPAPHRSAPADQEAARSSSQLAQAAMMPTNLEPGKSFYGNMGQSDSQASLYGMDPFNAPYGKSLAPVAGEKSDRHILSIMTSDNNWDTIAFQTGDSLEWMASQWLHSRGLNPAFRKGLMSQMRQMQEKGLLTATVDIVDLL